MTWTRGGSTPPSSTVLKPTWCGSGGRGRATCALPGSAALRSSAQPCPQYIPPPAHHPPPPQCFNCLDRHVAAGQGGRVCFHWCARPGRLPAPLVPASLHPSPLTPCLLPLCHLHQGGQRPRPAAHGHLSRDAGDGVPGGRAGARPGPRPRESRCAQGCGLHACPRLPQRAGRSPMGSGGPYTRRRTRCARGAPPPMLPSQH